MFVIDNIRLTNAFHMDISNSLSVFIYKKIPCVQKIKNWTVILFRWGFGYLGYSLLVVHSAVSIE